MDINKMDLQLSRRISPLACIFTLLVSFSTNSSAADSALDRVVAVVNKDVILSSEVQQLTRRLRASGSERTNSSVLSQQALESLISEKLQLQAAKREGINPDKLSLDGAVNSVASRNKMNLQQFKQALAKQGIDFESFRETISAQMIINSLKQRRSTQSTEVSSQEINDLITAESRQITANLSYHIQDILIPSPAATNIAGFNSAKRLATQARNLALRNQNFMSTKVGNSTARDLGWQAAKNLSFIFLSELTKLEPGQISNVISDAQGFHILKLVDQRGGGNIKSQQVRVRHILVAQTQPNAKAKIDSLRQQIVQGADFGNIAKANSDDIGSAVNAGDLGWSDSKRYVPEFARATETLQTKTLSPVIKTKFGYHILEVLDRKEIDASRRSLETQAQKLILSKKQEQDYDAWVQGLRSSAFIEYKKP